MAARKQVSSRQAAPTVRATAGLGFFLREAYRALKPGGTIVVVPRFNPLSFWSTVREHRATWYSAVPTIHQVLVARAKGLGLRCKVREILLDVFSAHHSKSVQHTLYAMGERVLADVPEIADIELSMPNKHCLLVDLSPFGQDNPNEIFVPIDEPHGYIEARIRRQG